MNRRYELKVITRTLWRELLALGAGGLAALLLHGTAPTAAAVALAVGLLGGGLLAVVTLRQGHLARALRWPGLCRALGLDPGQLQEPRLAPIADTAEEVLQTIDGALPAVRSYLAPARRDTLEVVGRALELGRSARRHDLALGQLSRRTLDRELLEAQGALEAERDDAVRAQLEERVRSLRLQCTVRDEHRDDLRRIEHELAAARQTLGAVDAGIQRADGALSAPAPDGPGACTTRAELGDQVGALALAATEISCGNGERP